MREARCRGDIGQTVIGHFLENAGVDGMVVGHHGNRLPIADIPAALRHDGHPPLYYVLLHLWMRLFGQGDVAVRALSGVWSLLLFPLVWVAGRRFGGTRVAWFAVALLGLASAIRLALS